MTSIIAVIDGDRVHIAADTGGTTDGVLTDTAQKLLPGALGNFVVGVSGEGYSLALAAALASTASFDELLAGASECLRLNTQIPGLPPALCDAKFAFMFAGIGSAGPGVYTFSNIEVPERPAWEMLPHGRITVLGSHSHLQRLIEAQFEGGRSVEDGCIAAMQMMRLRRLGTSLSAAGAVQLATISEHGIQYRVLGSWDDRIGEVPSVDTVFRRRTW